MIFTLYTVGYTRTHTHNTRTHTHTHKDIALAHHSCLARCTPHMSLKAFMRALARCTLALKRYAGIEHQACLQVDARAYVCKAWLHITHVHAHVRQVHAPLVAILRPPIPSTGAGGAVQLIVDEACAVVDSSACSGSFLGRLHWSVLFCTGASSLSLFSWSRFVFGFRARSSWPCVLSVHKYDKQQVSVCICKSAYFTHTWFGVFYFVFFTYLVPYLLAFICNMYSFLLCIYFIHRSSRTAYLLYVDNAFVVLADNC